MTRLLHNALSRTAQIVTSALLMGLLPQLCIAQQADPLDEALRKQLENPDASSHSDVFSRLVDHTRSVQLRLADQQLDRQTQDLQAKVLDDFDRLLEQLDATSPDSPEGSSPPDQQGASQSAFAASQDPMQVTSDSAQSGGHGQDGQTDPNAAAGQSAERSTSGALTEVERQSRVARANAAWGHLPPKLREELRGAFNESYLPQYDESVRRYYEALAARRRTNAAAEPSSVNTTP